MQEIVVFFLVVNIGFLGTSYLESEDNSPAVIMVAVVGPPTEIEVRITTEPSGDLNRATGSYIRTIMVSCLRIQYVLLKTLLKTCIALDYSND